MKPPDWPTVRAALIAAALFVNCCAASPIPTSIKPSVFKDPVAQEELERWVAMLGRAGIETTKGEFAGLLLTWGNRLGGVEVAVLKPFRGFMRTTGTRQSWGVFAFPAVYPNQLHVQVRQRGEWVTLYRALDPEATWWKRRFLYRRIRALYDGNASSARQSYENFVAWVAREALAEHPEADRARVFFVRKHVTPPGEPPDPQTTRRLKRTISREDAGL